jgi:hypothetical protein
MLESRMYNRLPASFYAVSIAKNEDYEYPV